MFTLNQNVAWRGSILGTRHFFPTSVFSRAEEPLPRDKVEASSIRIGSKKCEHVPISCS